MKEKYYSINIPFFLCNELNWCKSKTEARNVIEQGGIKINGKVIKDWWYPVESTKELLSFTIRKNWHVKTLTYRF